MDIQRLKQLKILVIGDYCIDVFKYGHCNRLSPEAPVPVFLYDHEIKMDGMAGNVNKNLLSLKTNSTLICSNKDSLKIRYVDIKSKQHLIRADYEKNNKPININSIGNIKKYDAIVISDYNKGSIVEENVKHIIENFHGPIFVDSKKNDLSIFKKCIIKINESEFIKCINTPKDSELIVTLGENGALYKEEIIPVNKKVTVFDVSGAGDSFMAGLVVQYLLKNDLKIAINFANVCASSVVKKTGTACIDFEEIKDEICF
jgi:D-beta-D-heptose 7-phosphate kinase/D-beta-D-heptose 1-phosphate adenosyltransferase